MAFVLDSWGWYRSNWGWCRWRCVTNMGIFIRTVETVNNSITLSIGLGTSSILALVSESRTLYVHTGSFCFVRLVITFRSTVACIVLIDALTWVTFKLTLSERLFQLKIFLGVDHTYLQPGVLSSVFVQLGVFSSEPSRQSDLPSHSKFLSMQAPYLQVNRKSGHLYWFGENGMKYW